MQYRIEKDSMGEVKVPVDVLWGPQTQRSKDNFRIGSEIMPAEVIDAFAYVKKAAAYANYDLGVISEDKRDKIAEGADAILSGEISKSNFPLVVWQTGSGTQSNMNTNEVISNYVNTKYKEKILHPNDDVNRSQSSNDTYPTAMSIASFKAVMDDLLPSLERLIEVLKEKEAEFMDVIKIGRTHLQDAVPVSIGQEISGWRYALELNYERIKGAAKELSYSALGGTAVGTGLNTPDESYDALVAEYLTKFTNLPIETAGNKFTSLSSKSEFAYAHGALSALAGDLMKMGNDIRWGGSGPRSGIGEYILPSNEPGSSIMPGKVNPTQVEALTMVCCQVMGNHTAIEIGASQGNFQLNVYLPMIAMNFLQSAHLLADSMDSFRKNCLQGLEVNREVIDHKLHSSLMLVTALTPAIGYDKAAEIANYAHEHDLTLKEAALKLDYISAEDFDRMIDPSQLV